MSKEAMKLALEHAKRDERHASHAETRYWCRMYRDIAEKAVKALAEQPAQQEPVAKMGMYEHKCPNVTGHRGPSFVCQKAGHGVDQNSYCKGCICPEALNTSPPASKPWVGLTDEEIERCMKQAYATVQGRNLERAFARAIEAKLRERNT